MGQRVLLRLTQDYLLVANTGKPFAERSLIAVCNSDSDKDSNDPLIVEETGESSLELWVDTILDRKLKAFRVDPSLLRRFNRSERQTRDDYKDRILLELLQNAIDADRSNPIGNKGRGFRSLLNIADEVRVHSRELHVGWSDTIARNALGALRASEEKLPVLELPGIVQPDETAEALLSPSLDGNFDTVVLIKLKSNSRAHIWPEWQKITSDPSILLFIDGNLEIRWECDEQSPIAWARKGDDKFVTIAIKSGDLEPQNLRWSTFHRNGAIAAYKVDEAMRFQPSGVTSQRLRCYFPAAQSPHPFLNLFLHHSGFKLQSNREAVQPSSDCLSEIAHVIGLAACSIGDPGNLLDALQLSPFNRNNTSSETEVWNAVQAHFRKLDIPALGNRKLSSIKTCPANDAERAKWKLQARLATWQAFLDALQQYRRGGLSNLPVLPPGVENEQREKTLLAFNCDCAFTISELRGQPWAPLGPSEEPISSTDATLCLPHTSTIFTPSPEIKVRFIDNQFVDQFKDGAPKGYDSLLTETLGVLRFKATDVIDHCVLTDGRDLDATPGLIDFLKELFEADKDEIEKANQSFDWQDEVRSRLAQQLHIKLQGKSWPLFRVYASKDWTGDDFIEQVYAESRGYLEMRPPTDKKERDQWVAFWKWLGVGWAPKVLPVLKAVDAKLDTDILKWNDELSQFKGHHFADELPQGWSEYCRNLGKDPIFRKNRKLRMSLNWQLDGGKKTLLCDGAFQVISDHWATYELWMKSLITYQFGLRAGGNDRNKDQESHLVWMLRTTPWIPCEDGSKQAGRHVFIPTSDVAKSLPKFVSVVKFPDAERGGNASLLKQCGVRSDWDEVNDEDWGAWLEQAAAMKDAESGAEGACSAIRILYTAVLAHRQTNTNHDNLSTKPQWCIEYAEGSNRWRQRVEDEIVYYVDKGHVADIELAGLVIFPQRLDGLEEKAMQHFGVKPLSEALSGTPENQGTEVDTFARRIQARRSELEAYLNGKKVSPLEILKVPRLRKVVGLRVRYELNGRPIGEPLPRRQFLYPEIDGIWTAYVDDGDCSNDTRWEVFAEALLLTYNLSTELAPHVQKLLSCQEEELPERLTKLGVAPETVKRMHEQRLALPTPEIPTIEHPPNAPPQTEQASGQPEIETLTSRPTVQHRPPVSSPRSHPPSTDSPPTSTTRRSSSRPHPQKGIQAQKWLYDRIVEWCEVNGKPPPEWEGEDRTDITIPTDPPIYIEAKRVGGATIHLSRNQISRAMSSNGTFVVALLQPLEPDKTDYTVWWVIRPLEELGNLTPRYVEWTWQPSKEAKSLDQHSWQVPETRHSKSADSYKIVVPIRDEWLQRQVQGLEEGLTQVQRAFF